MWDDGVTTDAATTADTTTTGPTAPTQTGTCATCARPAPRAKLRCDVSLEEEWAMLRATMGDDWFQRHAAYQRLARDRRDVHD
jgi:hypothetical protein